MRSPIHAFSRCSELSLDELNLEKGVSYAMHQIFTDDYAFESITNYLFAASLNDLVVEHIIMA